MGRGKVQLQQCIRKYDDDGSMGLIDPIKETLLGSTAGTTMPESPPLMDADFCPALAICSPISQHVKLSASPLAPMPVCLRPPLIAMPHYNIICTVQDSRVTSARSQLVPPCRFSILNMGFDPQIAWVIGRGGDIGFFSSFLAKRLGGPRKPTGYYKVWVVTIMFGHPRVNLS